MKSAAWLLVSGAVALACSSTDDVSPAERGVGPQELCAPIRRPLAAPNEDQYVFYPSDQAAVDALTEFLPKAGVPPPEPPGHPSQAVAEKLLAEVYPAFKRLYPTETVGLDDPPRVAIIDLASPNAFAISALSLDPADRKAPWVLGFHSGVFGAALNEDELRGLIGHELAHLVLRNRNDDVSRTYERRYLSSANEVEQYGAYVGDDAAAGARIDALEALHAVVGPIALPQFLGLPVPFIQTSSGGPQYDVLFRKAYEKYKPLSKDANACARFERELAAIGPLFSGTFEPGDYVITFGPNDRENMTAASERAKVTALQCLGGVERSIAAMVEELFGVAPKGLDADEKAQEEKYGGTDFFAELFELTQLKHEKLLDLESRTDLPLSNLRAYRGEEDADVAAVRVLQELGRPPRSVGLFIARTAGETYLDACVAKVEKGEIPPYGLMRSAHPASCWRYWNVDRIARTLETSCPR